MPTRVYRAALRAALASLALLAAGISLAHADPVARCNVGKPSYCLKYAQMFCVKENVRSDRETSCAAWQDACLKCHARIPACFGAERPLAKSAKCRACESDWLSCMHAIDKQFWPNRRKRR